MMKLNNTKIEWFYVKRLIKKAKNSRFELLF